MTGNLKALGLALVAAFAMGAVFASGAQALKLTSSEYPAILTADQKATEAHPEHRLTTSLGSVGCGETMFAGTVESAEKNEKITIQPRYEGCHIIIGLSTFAVAVNMTHCDYLLHGGVEVNPHEFKEGLVDLVCPNAGEMPHIEVYNPGPPITLRCSFTVTPFTNKGNITYFNITPEAGKKDVEFTTKIEGMKLDRTFGSLFQCGAAEQNATYTGYTTVRAYKDNGVHITSETPTIYAYTDGEQLDLTVSK